MAKVQLYAGGKRVKVTREEAMKMVERWTKEIEGSDGVFRVDISGRSWTKEAIAVIYPFMEKISKDVRYLNLNDVIASLLTDEGLAVTESLANMFSKAPVTDIDLSDNAMGPRGLILMEPLIAHAPLQRLYLANCGLSYESLMLLKEWAMADNCRIASGMRELRFDSNMTGTEGAKEVGELLAHCTKLEYFSYINCRTASGAIHLVRGLKRIVEGCDRPAILRLEMDDCTFCDEGLTLLKEVLSSCSLMRHLNLSGAGFGVDGVKQITDALTAAGAKMNAICLDACGELGSAGADILARFLENHATTLRSFRCSENELGDDGAVILLQAFGAIKCPLEELDLGCNEMEIGSAKALVQLVLPKLRYLNVAENENLPQKYLKAKYGNIVTFGDDEDGEEDLNNDEDGDMDGLIEQMRAASLVNT